MTLVGLGVFLLLLGLVFEILKIAVDVAGTLVEAGVLVLIIGAVYALARGITK